MMKSFFSLLFSLIAISSTGHYTEYVPALRALGPTFANESSFGDAKFPCELSGPDRSVQVASLGGHAWFACSSPGNERGEISARIFFGRSFTPVRTDDDALLDHFNSPPLLIAYNTSIFLITESNVLRGKCSFSDDAAVSCTFVPQLAQPAGWGRVIDAVAAENDLWIVTSRGLYRGGSSPILLLESQSLAAVGALPAGKFIAAGGSEKIYIVDTAENKIVRWEWVTQVDQEWGGVVDDAITSIAAHRGDLLIGNPACLNVLSGSKRTFDRIGGDEGLPFGNVTVVLPADDASVFIGTTMGLILWERNQRTWRYFYGDRYIVGDHVEAIAVEGSAVVVVTKKGVTFLEKQMWTLAKKAAHFEDVLVKRHQRHGLTAECSLSSFGNLSLPISHDSDNNGLWTSLIVAAEYMRYAVTKEKSALQTASRSLQGLALLFNVTNRVGLPARSACSPLEIEAKTCGENTAQWVTSSNPRFKGWTWKSDTSSDEIVGHVFGLSIAANLSPVNWERRLAANLLATMVRGIVQNGFQLIDWTQNVTTWGKWDPENVNENRAFSDERGLQSLQMLSFLAAARNVSKEDAPLLDRAYAMLCNDTNQYDLNMLNLKIQARIDDNFSDDELAFLPFFSHLWTCRPLSECGKRYSTDAVKAALARTYELTRDGRSSLWSAIALALLGDDMAPGDRMNAMDDIRWNLRTWPTSLIEWPVKNSQRIDILKERSVNRFGSEGTDSSWKRSPLPANERRQSRWNADPWDVSDGWTGLVEDDPGAFLLPYWMNRYFSLLDPQE